MQGKMKTGFIISLAVCGAVITGCKTGMMGIQKKYDWLASECALEKYPMQILKGDFIYKNGQSLYVPPGKTICNGMGKGYSTHVVGPELKPLPEKLYIHWFSYVENKFYEGTFDLPAEKIRMLFKTGVRSSQRPDKHVTYSVITVGLAPEGEISVYLQAELISLEVARFKAKEVQTEWTQFVDNSTYTREEFARTGVEEVLSEENHHKMTMEWSSGNIWHTYKKLYAWKPEVVAAVPDNLLQKTLNGERENFYFDEPIGDRTQRAMPIQLEVVWESTNHKKWFADIYLNEAHVIETFQRVYAEHPDQQGTVQMKVIEKGRTPERRKILRTVEVSLNIADESIPLKIDHMDVYQLRSN